MTPTENPSLDALNEEQAPQISEAESLAGFDSSDSPPDVQEDPHNLLEVGSAPYEWLYGNSGLSPEQMQAIMNALSAAIMKNKEQFQIETRGELELLQGSLANSLRDHISSLDKNLVRGLAAETIQEQSQPIVSQVVDNLAKTSQVYLETPEEGAENEVGREESNTRGLTPSKPENAIQEGGEERRPNRLGNIFIALGAFLSGLFAKINGFNDSADHALFNSFGATLTPEARQSLTAKVVFFSLGPIQIGNGKGQEIVTRIREKIEAGVKIQEMGKNLSKDIANAATIEDIEALIQNYEAQETPIDTTATEQKAQEAAEAEKIEKEFPVDTIIGDVDGKSMGFIRSKQKNEEGKYIWVVRKRVGGSVLDMHDEYCIVTSSKKPTDEEIKKANFIDITSLDDAPKKSVAIANIREFYISRGDAKYKEYGWFGGVKNDSIKPFKSMKLSKLNKIYSYARHSTTDDIRTRILLGRALGGIAFLQPEDKNMTLADYVNSFGPNEEPNTTGDMPEQPADDSQKNSSHPAPESSSSDTKDKEASQLEIT